ncbi:MAG: hypothetical protein ACRD2L_10775 [Terriglobia bacterium]
MPIEGNWVGESAKSYEPRNEMPSAETESPGTLRRSLYNKRREISHQLDKINAAISELDKNPGIELILDVLRW